MLNDGHGQGGLAVVVGQLTDVFNGELFVGKFYLKVLSGGRDNETG